MMAETRNVLYRVYDENDALLYVGATTRFLARIQNHESHKSWWDETATIRLERFDTWEELAEAEKAAIVIEGPRHNVAHLREVTYRPRRRRGSGALYQRASDGLWVGHVELPSRDGKRRRRTVASRDRATAQRKLDALKAQE